MNSDGDVQVLSRALEEQAAQLQQCSDPATRAAALGLLRSAMELHKNALRRILEFLTEAPDSNLLTRITRDPLVSTLLVLHDLHPDDLGERIESALARVTSKLQRHGASARLLAIDGDVVRVMVEGEAHCGSTIDSLKTMLENELVDAAPDAEIVVEAAASPASGFIPVSSLLPAGDIPTTDRVAASDAP